MTRTEFEQALTPEHVKTLRTIQRGLMTGPVLFAALVIFHSTQDHEFAGATAVAKAMLLSVIHIVLLLVALPLSWFLPNRVFSPAKLAGAPATQWAARQQTAILTRFFILELPVIFGLVVCIMAVFDGVLPRQGIYWLNLVSLAILLIVGIATLPTKERLVAWFKRRIGTA